MSLHVPATVIPHLTVTTEIITKIHNCSSQQSTVIYGVPSGTDSISVQSIRSGTVIFDARIEQIYIRDRYYPARLVGDKIYIRPHDRSSKLEIYVDIWMDFTLKVTHQRPDQGFLVKFQVPSFGYSEGEGCWSILGVSFERLLVMVTCGEPAKVSKLYRLTLSIHNFTAYVTSMTDPELRCCVPTEKFWQALEMDTRLTVPTIEEYCQQLYANLPKRGDHFSWAAFFAYFLENAPNEVPPIGQQQQITGSISSWPLQTPKKEKGCALLESQIELLRQWLSRKKADGSYSGSNKDKIAFLRSIGCAVNGGTKEQLERKLDEYIQYYIFGNGKQPDPHMRSMVKGPQSKIVTEINYH